MTTNPNPNLATKALGVVQRSIFVTIAGGVTLDALGAEPDFSGLHKQAEVLPSQIEGMAHGVVDFANQYPNQSTAYLLGLCAAVAVNRGPLLQLPNLLKRKAQTEEQGKLAQSKWSFPPLKQENVPLP